MDASRSAITSARPRLEVDGRARPELDSGLLRLLVSDHADGLATCEAEFGNWGANPQGQLGFLWFQRDVLDFGKRLAIKLGDEVLFEGQVTTLEAHFPPMTPPTLAVRVDDRLQDLRMTRRTRHFERMSDADIVTQIARDHGLQAEVNLSGPTWPLLVQANESDLAFLRRRMLVADADLRVSDGKLSAQPRPSRPRPALTLVHGGTLRRFSVAADLAHQSTALHCTGWDVASKQAVSEEATDSSLGNEASAGESGPQILQRSFGARHDTVSHRFPSDAASARTEAESHMRALSRRFVRGRGETDTDVRLRAGQSVQLDGLGPLFDGVYGLSEVLHRFDDTHGLRSEFTAERAWLGRP